MTSFMSSLRTSHTAPDFSRRHGAPNQSSGSRWGRVVAARLFSKQTKSKPGIKWLDHLITSIKVLDSASALLSFPYIKVATGITIQVLEIIQTANKNREEFHDLADSLVLAIVAIRDTLMVHMDEDVCSSGFAIKCQEYLQFLLEILAEINGTVRKTQSWKWYLQYASIRDRIAKIKRKIDDLRSTFTLMTMADLYLYVYRHLPRGMSTWNNHKPIRLIDAMNRTIDVPLELCSTRNEFHDFLKFLFRKRRGRSYVESGRYGLTDALEVNQPLTTSLWSFKVKPGVTILMNIFLQRSEREDATQGRTCPACGCICSHASLGDDVTCSSCGTLFRLSCGFIEEVEEASSKQDSPESALGPATSTSLSGLDSIQPSYATQSGPPPSDNEAFDIRDFRRFHIQEPTAASGSRIASPSTEPLIVSPVIGRPKPRKVKPRTVNKPKKLKARKVNRGDAKEEMNNITFSIPKFTGRHRGSNAAPTPPAYQTIYIPNVYRIPTCPPSPSLLPMISRRSSHPDHAEDPLASFMASFQTTAFPVASFDPPSPG